MENRSFTRARRGARALAAFVATALTVPQIATALEVDPAVAKVGLLPGRVIAEGKGDKAQGALSLQSYRVEELRFSRLQVTVRGKKVETDTAWRIVLIGGPFPVRDMPAVIWIDDVAIGWGQESPDLSALSTILFDRSLLKDGAQLSVSWGEHGERMKVPALLALQGSGGGDGKKGVER